MEIPFSTGSHIETVFLSWLLTEGIKKKEFKACRKCKNDPTLAHSFYYCSQECQGML